VSTFIRLDMSGANKFKAMLFRVAFLILEPLTCGEYVVSSDRFGTEKFKALVFGMSVYFVILVMAQPEQLECLLLGEGPSR